MRQLLLWTASCGLWSCSRCPDPQKIYAQAELEAKRGELNRALAEIQRVSRCFPSENSEWHWRFTILKAEILDRQGLERESLELLRPDLPAALDSSDLAVRRKLVQGIASAFAQLFSEADQFLEQGEVLAKEHHPELLGDVALKRGTLCFLTGDIEGATAAYRKAFQIAREKHDPFLEAWALEGLGVAATKTEHYDEAIDWDRAALEVARGAGSQYSQTHTLGNMAWCYLELGEFENALELYKQAEEAAARNGAIEGQMYWLTGIASVYSRQRNYAAAETVLTQALDLARRQDNKRTLTVFLNDLAGIELELRRNDLAEKYLQEASEVEKNNPDPAELLQTELLGGRTAEKKGQYDAAERSFLRIISDPAASSSLKWEAEARLASVYAEGSLNGKAEKEFRLALDTVEAVRSSVQAEELRLSFLSSAITFYGDYIDFLIAHGKSESALQVADLSRARTLAEGLDSGAKASAPKPVVLRPQQLARQWNATLLFYWIGEKHSYLWAITPAQIACFPLASEPEIGALVKNYRQAILDGRDVMVSNRENGEKLYDMLVAPARKMIGGNSRILLLPAEGLYGLNFETLIVREPKPHFWIEDVTLTTASSLTLLASASHKASARQNDLLLIGNTEPADPDFPVLAQARAEMNKVEEHFPVERRAVLEGKKATPSAYVNSNPGRFAYLHFVAHGTASHTRPLESAVILSREGDSYKLYARDIVRHPLKAQLVTISACNSSGARTYSGEGLVGLSWAFLRAGAHNVVGALWEVSDASSTAQLIGAMYEGLGRGQDPATALRDAKLLVLHSDRASVFKKPFYWAPFQLYAGS